MVTFKFGVMEGCPWPDVPVKGGTVAELAGALYNIVPYSLQNYNITLTLVALLSSQK